MPWASFATRPWLFRIARAHAPFHQQESIVSQPIVRRAVLEDLESLVGMFDGYRRFYGREADLAGARDFLRERLGREESVIFIAHNGAEPAGFTQLYPSFSSVSMARIFVLNDLFVQQEHRAHGTGRALLEAAVEFATAAGAAYLTLSTAHTNRAAQSLYASCGWQRDEEYATYNYVLMG